MRSSFLLVTSLFGLGGCFGLQTNTSTETGLLDTGYDEAAEGQDAPPTDVELAGKLYVVAPSDLTLVEPPGLDALFHEALNQNVFVYVADESASSLTLQLALAASDGSQNPCETVRTLPDAAWQNPEFSVGSGELEVSFAGHPATLRHIAISGTFDEYAFNWRDGTMSAQLDARELTDALGGEDACELVANVGGACEACEDGAIQCVTLRFEDVMGAQSNVDFDPTPTCN